MQAAQTAGIKKTPSQLIEPANYTPVYVQERPSPVIAAGRPQVAKRFEEESPFGEALFIDEEEEEEEEEDDGT